jgi:hypothetical protein
LFDIYTALGESDLTQAKVADWKFYVAYQRWKLQCIDQISVDTLKFPAQEKAVVDNWILIQFRKEI